MLNLTAFEEDIPKVVLSDRDLMQFDVLLEQKISCVINWQKIPFYKIIPVQIPSIRKEVRESREHAVDQKKLLLPPFLTVISFGSSQLLFITEQST